MAIRYPLKHLSQLNFQELSAAEINYISYAARKKYASEIINNNYPFGSLTGNPAFGFTLISNYVDTRLKVVTRYADDDSTPEDYSSQYNPQPYYKEWLPSDYPTLAQMTLTTTYSLYQRRDTVNDPAPNAPTGSVLDNDSYLYYDSTDNSLRVASTTDLEDTIINDALTEMKTGDEVGSYRISTSTPTVGNSSDWYDLGIIYRNTLMDDVINYRLYIRYKNTALESQTQNIEIMRLYPDLNNVVVNADRIRGNTISNFIDGIIINLLERNHITYELRTSSLNAGDINRGSISDTSYNGAIASYEISDFIPGGVSGYYKRTDYPSLTSTIVLRNIYYLVITN